MSETEKPVGIAEGEAEIFDLENRSALGRRHRDFGRHWGTMRAH